MKKWILISLTLVPFIAGHIINSTLTIPVLGVALYYVLPLLTTVFWFWLARQYARNWRTIPALLVGNGEESLRCSLICGKEREELIAPLILRWHMCLNCFQIQHQHMYWLK